MREPLGTLRSWTLHGAMAGALTPPVLVLAILVAEHLLFGRAPDLRILKGFAVVSLLGAGLGTLLGPLAWRAASSLWRVPLMTFALGPILGASSAWALQVMLVWALDGHGPSVGSRQWLALLSLGACAVGPPWVAYVAVRSRGRPGWPVVLASTAWSAAAAVLMVLWYWLDTRGYP